MRTTIVILSLLLMHTAHAATEDDSTQKPYDDCTSDVDFRNGYCLGFLGAIVQMRSVARWPE